MALPRARSSRFLQRTPSVLVVVLLLLLFELATGLYIWRGGTADRLFLAVINLHLYWGLGLLVVFLLKLVSFLRRKPLGRHEALSLGAVACFGTATGTGLLLIFQGPSPLLIWSHLLSSLVLIILVPLHLLATRRYLAPLWRPRDAVDPSRRRAGKEAAQILAFLAFFALGAGAFIWGLRALRGVALGGPQGFPVTTWTETPDPSPSEAWQLSVAGAVQDPRTYTLAQLRALGARTAPQELICVTGWRATPVWEGVPLTAVLAEVGPSAAAQSLTFVSLTGYRWDLSWDEAKQATLAWGVNGEPLAHAHGAPLRLVAPGRRGVEWVKWIVAMEVNERPVQTFYP